MIESNTKYEKLFNLLLSHVYVAENETSLKQFESDDDKSMVVLSKSGNFLRQKYVVGGGSIGLFDGKRTGKFKNLEQLAEKVKDHEVIIEQYKEQIKIAEQSLSQIKSKAQNAQQDINKQESEFISLSGQVNSLQSNRDFLANGFNVLQSNIDKLAEESSAIIRMVEEENANPDISPATLKAKLQNQEQQLNVQQEQSAQLQRESGEKSQAFNQHNILFLQQQNRIQNLIRELGFKHNQSTTLVRNKEQYAQELESIKAQTEQLLGSIETSNEGLKTLLSQREAMELQLQTLEKDYFKSKGSIEAQEKNLSELRRKKEQADTLIQSVHDELNELKLQMNSLKERLNLEFNIDINDLLDQQPDETINEEEMRPRAEKLRKQIGEFGPINPMALEYSVINVIGET